MRGGRLGRPVPRPLHDRPGGCEPSSSHEATRLARRFGDTDLEFDALAHTGLMMVEEGRVTEGMRCLDESAAAARGGEVASPVVSGEIYCKLLVACESTLDVRRAEEWLPVTSPLGDRPEVAWASAICRTHYGGILVVAGRWDEAERELEQALRLYDASYRALRPAALARLAELRVRQGRLSESRELLSGQAWDGYAIRPWARTEWLCAEDVAERGVVASRLVRALGSRPNRLLDVPTLALLTEMQVACGDVQAATRTAATILELTTGDPVDVLVAYARQSNACVAAATGARGSDARVAVTDLDGAITIFTTAGLPLEAAAARLRLAELVHADDPALARAEARTAAESFAWLGAPDELDRATCAAAVARRSGADRRTPRRVTHRQGGGGARPRVAGTEQPADRRAALHQPQDRLAPREQRADQAGPSEPGRGGRVGRGPRPRRASMRAARRSGNRVYSAAIDAVAWAVPHGDPLAGGNGPGSSAGRPRLTVIRGVTHRASTLATAAAWSDRAAAQLCQLLAAWTRLPAVVSVSCASSLASTTTTMACSGKHSAAVR